MYSTMDMALCMNTTTPLQLRREFKAITNLQDSISGLVDEWVTKWQNIILLYMEKEASSSTTLAAKLADAEGNMLMHRGRGSAVVL